MRGDYGGDVHVKEREEYETRADYPSVRAQSKEEKKKASACHFLPATASYPQTDIYLYLDKSAFTTTRLDDKK